VPVRSPNQSAPAARVTAANRAPIRTGLEPVGTVHGTHGAPTAVGFSSRHDPVVSVSGRVDSWNDRQRRGRETVAGRTAATVLALTVLTVYQTFRPLAPNEGFVSIIIIIGVITVFVFTGGVNIMVIFLLVPIHLIIIRVFFFNCFLVVAMVMIFMPVVSTNQRLVVAMVMIFMPVVTTNQRRSFITKHLAEACSK
jgi:K+-sensing histidine kinase KdpD